MRTKVQTYFCAIGLKKSLAEPDDFFITKADKGATSMARRRRFPLLPQWSCGRALGRPEAARLDSRDECTCDRASGRVHEER
jgi:hypothetical protein